MSQEVEVIARRNGTGKLLGLHLPKAISGALPDGGHIFAASFTDGGILLRYIGPATPTKRRSSFVFDTPAWANGEQP